MHEQRGEGTLGVPIAQRSFRIALGAVAAVALAIGLLGFLGLADGAHTIAACGMVAVLATRSQEIVLAHPTRARILSHLTLLPGDHFRSIVRNLGLGVGEVRHHLNILVRNGLVREQKTNGRCRYYVRGNGPETERNELFAKHWDFRDMRFRVLFAVRKGGEATASRIATTLGISRQLAGYHLARLEDLGLVRRDGRIYRE